jgi:hypothetical protein
MFKLHDPLPCHDEHLERRMFFDESYHKFPCVIEDASRQI